MFLVLEGLDGAGTTTQSERLVAALRARGGEVVQTREPTDGPVGLIIRDVLRGDQRAPSVETLPWLFAADRADHLTRKVEPALRRGAYVVSDRYYHSSLAYQSLTLPLEKVAALNDFRSPHITFFLDVPVDECLARITKRGGEREIYEQRDKLERIAAAYDKVLDLVEQRGETVIRIDGTGTPKDVHEAILAAVP
ncbi:MAG: dTMP kinase [Deltaproteobacteria bacterium]|nr:MAG: dTMP kinase [Deltaproteobacteria bacterium]